MNEIPENLYAGPCIVCGRTNYALSCGGPSICPTCDTGYSGPQLIKAQKQELDKLRGELRALLAERDALRESGRFLLNQIKDSSCVTYTGSKAVNLHAYKEFEAKLNATLNEGEKI